MRRRTSFQRSSGSVAPTTCIISDESTVPASRHSSSVRPCTRACRNPAAKKSPAAVVSVTCSTFPAATAAFSSVPELASRRAAVEPFAPNFTMKRMIDDYINRFYLKESKYAKALKKNNFAKAKELVAWKKNVTEKWDGISVLETQIPSELISNSIFGQDYTVRVKLNTNGLADSIGVEMVIYSVEKGNQKYHTRIEFHEVSREGDVVTYELKDTIKSSGVFHYGFRIFPKIRIPGKLRYRVSYSGYILLPNLMAASGSHFSREKKNAAISTMVSDSPDGEGHGSLSTGT